MLETVTYITFSVFFCRHISNPRFVNTVIDVANIFLGKRSRDSKLFEKFKIILFCVL